MLNFITLDNNNNCQLNNINTNFLQNINFVNLFNNFNEINEDSEEDKKEDDNSSKIKYSWLKKEKYTQEIMNKIENGLKCTICLENLKLNQDINILKCSHIFHYKCLENLIDHNFNRCPNCRCDLKTGEKQPYNPNNELNLYSGIFLDYSFIDDEIGNISFSEENFWNERNYSNFDNMSIFELDNEENEDFYENFYN